MSKLFSLSLTETISPVIISIINVYSYELYEEEEYHKKAKGGNMNDDNFTKWEQMPLRLYVL